MKRLCVETGLIMCMTYAINVSGLDKAAGAEFVIGEPINLGPNINTSAGEVGPSVSADGLSLYFTSENGYGGRGDIWVATRPTTDSRWGPATNLGSVVNSSACEAYPSISPDGLSLFFSDGHWGVPAPQRPGGFGDVDLWMTTRLTQDSEWNPPVNLGPVINSPSWDGAPAISSDGLSLYFGSNRPGGHGGQDIYVARRATMEDPWGAPVNLGPPVNSVDGEAEPSISADGRILFFSTTRTGAAYWDLWMTKRRTSTDNWELPVSLGPTVNTASIDWGPEIAPDNSTLYFTASRSGGMGYYDLWEAPIMPIIAVDFNANGQVDIDDLVRLIEAWDQEELMLDIAPLPFGDGIVDRQDLELLMSYWGQEVDDPRLVAHWPLDETSGMVAVDAVGMNPSTLVGSVAWQPEGGKVGGALAFDGSVGFARSNSLVLDPAQGALTAIAWVKGGAPGRAILSQESGADWLYLNQYGMLTTDLKAIGATGKPLTSNAYVLDEQWHRVAVVWDSMNRSLYMDRVEVAKDTQPSLAPSGGKLQIGAGKTRAATSFWSGLIDDVRLYNRAVVP